MTNRLDFIEDGSGSHKSIRPDSLTADDEVNYPVLATYDFGGTGPRSGIRRDIWLYSEAAKIETRGERMGPRLIRILWILIRLAVGLGFLLFVLRGNTFSCAGTDYLWS